LCLRIGNLRNSLVEISRALGAALALKRAIPPPVGDETREEIRQPPQESRKKPRHSACFFDITDQMAVPMMMTAPTT
jgi:hypothetical protein